ncbi:effector-associated constant component EACC1 [Streptomyces sp. MUM 178J]|uniref:effector-associated constant component EACC1 n=1 Tax=Streptomyces sp. MUM 178J TaxID=2791991 RepID=UPI001F0404B0|nr:hypothetical protein [Streptomyces sp. MUM 178J]WRQ79863.1 hypothetical protein I3F59_011180 [Streptomyces sp. MUM 178J]
MKTAAGAAPGGAGPVDVTITLLADEAGDELRSLHGWLTEEDALRGRVRLTAAPPGPGTMGAAAEALLVVLAPGGALAVLSGVLITWLRQRTSDVTLTALRDGDRAQVKLSAKRVRGLDGAGLQRQISEVEHLLRDELPEGESDAGSRRPVDE